MMTGMISFDKDDDMGNTSKDLIRYRKSQNITETPADSVFPEDSEGPPPPGPHAVPFSLSITSDLFFFDTQPEPLDPVRQRLTVNRNGRIWFSEKLFWQWEMERSGPENGGHAPGRHITLSIGKEKAAQILSMCDNFLKSEGCEPDLIVTFIGSWEMELRFSDGGVRVGCGPMCGLKFVDISSESFSICVVDMDAFIKEKIPIENMRLFDQRFPDGSNREETDI